jgi:hypothetical protein
MRYNETEYTPLNIIAGVQPTVDASSVKTRHYTYSDKVRFVDGIPRKIKGYTKDLFTLGAEIQGTTRSLFSETINGKYYLLAGTNKKLYSLIGSVLTNITPLLTTSTTIADSLNTDYTTLVNNPIATVNGSPLVVITVADAERYQRGDTIYISGAVGFAGLTSGQLNGDAIVREITPTTITLNVGSNANSTTIGGGASVVLASGLITVNATTHGQLNGDRVKIDDAVSFGGILNTQINSEFIIRNATANTFDVMTIGEATSAVTGGGGADTEYFKEIPDGALNESNFQGYGAGLYGIGLYGVALTSDSARSFPRMWHFDKYGNNVILTAGNQSAVYLWGTSNQTAPVVIPNAPTAINYAFVSNNILVVFGEGGIENRITGSDIGNIENWTSSSINQVFRDDIEGAGRLISHCPVEDYNLIFTENKTYTFRYIGQPFIWEVLPLDESIGCIAPNARVSVKGMAVWMGQDNFYMYRGGSIEVIPANTQSQSTCLKYVFENLNWGQKSKCFAWYNKQFDEVWFHYPSAGSMECDRVAVVNMRDFSWGIHLFDRTAAEYPQVKLKNPRLANIGDIFRHENGNDANGQPLDFTLVSNLRYNGKSNTNIIAVIPDSVGDKDVIFEEGGVLFPQSVNKTYENTFTITPSTERVQVLTSARFHEYTWKGEELGQEWIMGEWMEEIKRGSPE